MDASQLEAGLPTANQEKRSLAAAYSPKTAHNEPQPQHRRKMQSSRRVILAILALVLVTLGVASAVPARSWGHGPCDAQEVEGVHVQPEGGNEESGSFPCLLNAVSSEALHDVLHRYFPNRFKDGIYESDKNAMEAVHREDASLATSLVKIAKRQGGGGNNTTSAAPTTPQPPPSTTRPAPTTPTTTSAETTPTSQPPTTGPAPTTPSTRQTTPSTSSSTTSAGPTTSQGTTTPTSTSSTTRVRSSRPVTSTFTSTASNGGLVIVTQTSFVDADPGEPTGTNPGGSLQTNAAVPRARNVAVEAFAGVLLGGLILV
ncbi:hypothetical protein MCOR27_011182 [Pyricularia oryzae]|uniref:Uncharacterized protein n=2 Tax=Pyricularia TaxID=48558 RepID=A0ABQ8NCU0_PYRGI|nr:hypothetical protein MCOR19_010987 [Pyricularia oryzae]KAI6295014.1 hypothetical protein MCOR33_008016 [Pyricularia grisea]KAI6266000.1 hypothetical protein MCOR27_011182 [Pyricularia oryzae]KAI6319567.1 hypothetical protein MCOR29_005506 [Pyricularia oryzae]KAI6335473.1 hypothetical protein MCOR28_009659 [Pyricularia oryzae]